MLAPLSGLAVPHLAGLEDLQERLLWCQLLQILRLVIVCLYFNTFFFNFIFRVVLVRFPDRGLVSGGRPSLVLFHQLYWTISLAFFVIMILLHPVVPILRGTFQETTQARICLLLPLNNNFNVIKGQMQSLVFPCLTEVYNRYWLRKVRRLVEGLCPNGRMSCVGSYRRNLLPLEETSKYLTYWAVYAAVEGTIVITYMTTNFLQPSAYFWLHFALGFAFIEVYHGVVIPLRMEVPALPAPRGLPGFYVRAPLLQPRRYVEGSPLPPSPPPASPLPCRRPLVAKLGRLGPQYPALPMVTHTLNSPTGAFTTTRYSYNCCHHKQLEHHFVNSLM